MSMTRTHGTDTAAERAALEAALGEQYDLRRLLGRGGMGTVYLAHERSLDRLVAIKVLQSSAVDDDVRHRFVREAQTAARLTHPNIVPLHSFGRAGDALYYVMGYVEGESLESLLTRTARLPAEDARRILLALADALDYAHRNGVVHRDIKPDNILIERGTGRAVLTDFGIAKLQHARSSLTQSGVIIGTPHYMSPEQAAGDRTMDGRSDLYSLGVVGYRMLSGRLPFDAPSVQALLAQHVTRLPTPMANIAPDIPQSLVDAVTRCLAKVPDDRWRDAQSLRGALAATDDSLLLPDGVEHLPGYGVRLLALLGISLLVLEALYVATSDRLWVGLAALMPLFAGALAIAPAIAAWRSGMSPERVWHLLFAPPIRWSGWWPRTFRRMGDVWFDLPPILRRARSVLSITAALQLVLALPILVAVMVRLATSTTPMPSWAVVVPVVIVGIALASTVMETMRVFRWGKERGFDKADINKLLAVGTVQSPFWKRPEVATLLQRSSTPWRAVASEPVGASALAHAISELAAEFRYSDPVLAASARDAALAIARATNAIEDAIRIAARELDPAEQEHLESRLAALNNRTDPSGARSRMRSLLESQLALLREIAERHSALVERRDALAEHMRTLWLHLSNLRAAVALGAASAIPREETLSKIVDDIDYLVTAAREVESL